MARLGGRGAALLITVLVAICYGQVVWWYVFQQRRGRELARLQREIEVLRAAEPGAAPAAGEASPAAAADLIAARARRDSRMFAAEGAFFLAAITAGAGLVYAALRQERRLKRRQRELLDAVSHEFNTPLQSLRLSLETMAGRELPPARRERYLERMSADVDRLAGMVDRLLTIQRLAAGAPPPPAGDFDLSEAVEAARRSLEPRLQAAGMAMETEGAGAAPVHGRLSDLAHALELLLDNAVNYAAQGGRVRVSWGRGADGRVFAAVEDAGPGLAAEDLQVIFERFERGSAARGGTAPGAGLGLAIARRIAEEHGGRLTAGPARGGAGARFELSLPPAGGRRGGAA